ncbi:thiol:disulfide interchange protein DsbA/DsbL [Amantichitinum ursilacus]|uniref:Thiol:disulfide interchange protein n=1 Tax=Amantichitinum ursilacus TaxID=857265 RepID=A0A0N0GMV7_9NEIS|nr:thiol:disulfide interchange protein DsbA/DsbL [Amantichitinum ursilacus]KPC52099.1 Thiol:disulfide interchange protein DsbA precursor [Amantichitinum ursilacus]
MTRWLKAMFLAVGLLTASVAAHADIKEGTEYKLLTPAQPVAVPGKIEVIEFFWYGCPHCFHIEPYVEDWAAKLPKDVNFRRAHVVWQGRNDIIAHAKIFIALNTMGIAGKYQQAVFNAIQRDGLELRKDDVLYDWVKKQGIDVAKFKAAYNSFSGSVEMNKLNKMVQDYQVDGVPMFIVNGKYVTAPSMVGKEDGTVLTVVDQLIAKERKK